MSGICISLGSCCLLKTLHSALHHLGFNLKPNEYTESIMNEHPYHTLYNSSSEITCMLYNKLPTYHFIRFTSVCIEWKLITYLFLLYS